MFVLNCQTNSDGQLAQVEGLAEEAGQRVSVVLRRDGAYVETG